MNQNSKSFFYTRKDKEIASLKLLALELHGGKNQHDHDCFHDDCGLCQVEKRNYEEFKKKVEACRK